MIGLLVLFGCADRVVTPSGPDFVRAAVWLEVSTPALLAFPDGDVLLGLVLNSDFPCEPEDLRDDPDTEHLDEEEMAELYWDAQLASALTREGAFVAGYLLYREPGQVWRGAWDLHEDTMFDPQARVEADGGRAAAGFWYHVTDAGVDDRDEALLQNETETYEADFQVAAPAWVDIDSTEESVLEGAFDYWPAQASGTFHAERCASDRLEGKILAALIELGIL